MLFFCSNTKRFVTIFVFIFVFSVQAVVGQLSVASLFNHHAVLQRGKPLPVWGWAKAGAKVTVTVAGNTAMVTADKSGKWMAQLSAMPAGGPICFL
jgi:sialate O-acetylesterase